MTTPLQQDAYQGMLQQLQSWGLQSLAPDLLGFVQQGQTPDQISVSLQSTNAYKQRFAGNAVRQKNGLPVLSPADYLNVEAAYRQILSSNGMPVGFYDQPSDFANWIGNDVAPTEVSNRVNLAVDAANKLDAGTKKAFYDYYGLQPNDIAAFFLDQHRALPQLQKISNGIQVAGAYNDAGLSLTQSRAEQLGGLVGSRDAQQLANTAIEAAYGGRDLSAIYGGMPAYGQTEAENEVFGQNEAARQKRLALGNLEQANFSGTSGVGRATMTQSTNY